MVQRGVASLIMDSMASAPLHRPYTAEEYAQLPDVEGFRDELIEGERVLSPMPKLAHVLVLNQEFP